MKTVDIYLSLHLSSLFGSMSYSYLVRRDDELISEIQGYFPKAENNSLLSCLEMALNDLDFDLSTRLPDQVTGINIMSNFEPFILYLSNKIQVPENTPKLEKFKDLVIMLQGRMIDFNFSFSNSNYTIIDNEFNAIKLTFINEKVRSFWDYDLKTLKDWYASDKDAFIKYCKAEKWNEIRVAKKESDREKIGFVQGILNTGKADQIRRTLDLFGGYEKL